jgi:hypothetical protein
LVLFEIVFNVYTKDWAKPSEVTMPEKRKISQSTRITWR